MIENNKESLIYSLIDIFNYKKYKYTYFFNCKIKTMNKHKSSLGCNFEHFPTIRAGSTIHRQSRFAPQRNVTCVAGHHNIKFRKLRKELIGMFEFRYDSN